MSNPDALPGFTQLGAGEPCSGVEVLDPRLVPLGGIRAMTVYRTLPQRQRSLVGAWCFLDHYGPDEVAESGGMEVPRHPHTGLATVSWLFTGRIEHLDSGGTAAGVLPGELNLMIAGRGITHQEISGPEVRTLHGVQLWYALPEATRHSENHFEHYAPDPVTIEGVAGPGATARVFIGELAEAVSPVDTRTPELLGAELLLDPGATISLTTRRDFEYAALAENASIEVNGVRAAHRELAYVPAGADTLTITAGPEGARVILLGGVPLGEEIVMWWNFIGRDHDEIAEYRRRYQAEMGLDAPDQRDAGKRPLFGEFPAGQLPPLPAPPLPIARLQPRA
ncbi:redox-sensitive bicupin YhaK (pirin superfamily) [Leucobacter exalbidus]|uniref:Redox-sensitive bicupin YhaK (Pirin superfamily) n=1 Tax=Leucobacter exalbidus TaxID=662960 RepID=A0A940PXM3_9MICO|nr:pirin family protein [Leucobacter exalbidus]MBP1326051.1 redox-sensitive bicupin YhaK (pirin superfamily) [Leucobacter exalbidus]